MHQQGRQQLHTCDTHANTHINTYIHNAPVRSRAATSAPASTSATTTCECPFAAARCSAVHPLSSLSSSTAPSTNSVITADFLPLVAALMSGVTRPHPSSKSMKLALAPTAMRCLIAATSPTLALSSSSCVRVRRGEMGKERICVSVGVRVCVRTDRPQIDQYFNYVHPHCLHPHRLHPHHVHRFLGKGPQPQEVQQEKGHTQTHTRTHTDRHTHT